MKNLPLKAQKKTSKQTTSKLRPPHTATLFPIFTLTPTNRTQNHIAVRLPFERAENTLLFSLFESFSLWFCLKIFLSARWPPFVCCLSTLKHSQLNSGQTAPLETSSLHSSTHTTINAMLCYLNSGIENKLKTTNCFHSIVSG